MSTYSPKPGDITHAWHVIDATDVVLGRLAAQAAHAAARQAQADVRPAHGHRRLRRDRQRREGGGVTGNKRTDKFVYRHSGYPGGLRQRSVGEMLEKHPDRLVEKADQGHAAEEPPRAGDGQEAQGLRGPRAPALRAEARPATRSTRSRSDRGDHTGRGPAREHARARVEHRDRARDPGRRGRGASRSSPISTPTSRSRVSTPSRPSLRSSPTGRSRPSAGARKRSSASA